MFCSEYLEPIHGGVEVGALSSNKCAQILEGHIGVWVEMSWRW